MSSLLQDLQQLAETGDPYFRQAITNARKVKIHTVRRDSLMTMLLKGGMPGFEALPRKCYDNSLHIALALEQHGVSYVEGFVMFRGQINSHAWICHQGRYFDPTYEAISKRKGYSPSMMKAGEYVSIAEMSASYAWANCIPGGRSIEYLPPVPVTISMWGCDESKREIYAAFGYTVDGIVEELKKAATAS